MTTFRQRLAWLCVALYLLLSVLAVYLVFEADFFGLERVQRGGASSWVPPPTVPRWVWGSAFVLPYLQVFLLLFSCTRAEPRSIGYCLLPVCLLLLCSRHKHKAANHRTGLLIHT